MREVGVQCSPSSIPPVGAFIASRGWASMSQALDLCFCRCQIGEPEQARARGSDYDEALLAHGPSYVRPGTRSRRRESCPPWEPDRRGRLTEDGSHAAGSARPVHDWPVFPTASIRNSSPTTEPSPMC